MPGAIGEDASTLLSCRGNAGGIGPQPPVFGALKIVDDISGSRSVDFINPDGGSPMLGSNRLDVARRWNTQQTCEDEGLDLNLLSYTTVSAEHSMQSRKLNRQHASASFANRLKTPASFAVVPDPVPADIPAVASSGRALPQHEIDFAELADGTLVEMIEDPNNAANPLFAVYKNGTVEYAARVEGEDRVLVPVSREQTIFKHVRLPRGTQPYESSVKLLAGIATLVLACVDVCVDDASLIAAFVMSTWFIESLEIAPYLELVGLPRSGKTTLLHVLNQVCRRPLLTADITSAAFYEVYEKLSPTLLVDEMLTAGNQPRTFPSLENWNDAWVSNSPQGPFDQGLRSKSN